MEKSLLEMNGERTPGMFKKDKQKGRQKLLQ